MDRGKRVFLMCAGSASRWGGRCKHLLKVDGEPIIRKTIRLIREIDPGIPISIVSWRDELRFNDCGYIDTHKVTPCLAASQLLTVPYWTGMNYLLMGDVKFNKKTLEKVLKAEEITTFGNYSVIGKMERVAVVYPENTDVTGLIKACIIDTSDKDGQGGIQNEVQANFHSWYHYWYFRHLHYKSGILGFFVWHVMKKIWEPQWRIPGSNIQDLKDDTVYDFDRPEEYEHYLAGQNRPDRSSN